MSDDLIRRSDAIEALEKLSACEKYGEEFGTNDETYIGKYEAISDDLISRQAVIKLVENTPYSWDNLTERTKMIWTIRAIPSVELKTNKTKGEWIKSSNDWTDGQGGARYFPYHCSECGFNTWSDDLTNFCPNCGAYMKGASDE